MPKYLTVQRFHELYCQHIRTIHVKTVYEWINTERLKAKRDHGGRNWLIVVDEDDPLLSPIVD